MNVGGRVVAHVTIVVLLTMSLGFCLALIGLIVANRQAREAQRRLATEVVALETSVAALQTATYDAQTDAGVERWARDQQKWAREGDHVIVPVEPTPAGPGASYLGESEDPPWARLWRWLRGG
jgi:hypothetical protein